MKIHEYQAKELFKKYGVPVPEGGAAHKPDEAAALAKKLANYPDGCESPDTRRWSR